MESNCDSIKFERALLPSMNSMRYPAVIVGHTSVTRDVLDSCSPIKYFTIKEKNFYLNH